jgi:hypothetical protein
LNRLGPDLVALISLLVCALILLCGFLSARPVRVEVSAKQPQESWLSTVFLICPLSILLVKRLFTSTEVASLPNLRTIEFVETVNLKGQINTLEAVGGYCVYLGQNFRRVAE